MLHIGAFEAKNSFSELLRRVEQGEEVIITRHGKTVAMMITPEKGRIHKAKEAFGAWRKLAGSIKDTSTEELITWVKSDRP
jgi:prevent-host-death family protein